MVSPFFFGKKQGKIDKKIVEIPFSLKWFTITVRNAIIKQILLKWWVASELSRRALPARRRKADTVFMIEFKTPELSDRALVDSYFLTSGYRCCEFAFTNIFAWRDAFQEEIGEWEGYLAVRCMGNRYFWPAGKGDIRPMLRQLERDAAARGARLSLYALNEGERERLEGLYPGKFEFISFRDSFDYCYDIHRLADLTGKKLHAKRNHIHRFEERFPDWTVEEIGPDNLQECVALNEDWEAAAVASGHEDWNARMGSEALRKCLRHQEALGLEGLALRGGGKLLAFTMGKSLGGDTYDVFFEKAYADVQGAYPMINREFARWVRERHPEIVYMNREDDMGEENLRKSKLSYHPDLLLEKYIAELKEGETLWTEE